MNLQSEVKDLIKRQIFKFKLAIVASHKSAYLVSSWPEKTVVQSKIAKQLLLSTFKPDFRVSQNKIKFIVCDSLSIGNIKLKYFFVGH